MDLRAELVRLQGEFKAISASFDKPRVDYYYLEGQPENWRICGSSNPRPFRLNAEVAASILPLVGKLCPDSVLLEQDPAIRWVLFVANVADCFSRDTGPRRLDGFIQADGSFKAIDYGTIYDIAGCSVDAINWLLARLPIATEEPEAPRQESMVDSTLHGAGVKPSKVELALGVLIAHPEWTVKRIAAEVGCHQKTLSGSEQFKQARGALKLGKANLPRGSKNGKTGDIEAWSD